MSRFLFVVPPLPDRAPPARAVADELERRGHVVAWTGLDERPAGDGPHPATTPPPGGLRSPTGVLVLWDDFLLPLARDMLPVVHEATTRFAPDALVVDDQALAGAAVALRVGLPWATLVPNSAGLADPLWDLPAIARLVRCRTTHLLRDAGLDGSTAAMIDPRRSPHLVIAFSTEALAGPVDDPAGRYQFVGPHRAPTRADDDVAFDWDRLRDDRPLVIVTLESPPPRSDHLHRVAAEALATLATTLDVQGVVVGPADLSVDPSPDLVVAPRVPLRALLRRAAAVVCDAGPTTVGEALAHGVPLVVAPMIGEQPLLAEQVVQAGGAVPANASPVDVPGLAQAIRTALGDDRVRKSAEGLRDSFLDAAGPTAAADRLEGLVS